MTHEDFGFAENVIPFGGTSISYYVYKKHYSELKPNFLFIQGSIPCSLCVENKGNYKLTFALHTYSDLIEAFNFIIISKPGYRFCEPCGYLPKEYLSLLSLEFRTLQAVEVIKDVFNKPGSYNKNFLICGHSEGANVAAHVAFFSPYVTHLVLLSGGGPTQYFDFTLEIRKRITTGEISFTEGQSIIEKLFLDFKEIQKFQKSTSKLWKGHTFLRWSSFSNAPVDVLKKISIPIYIAMGSNDNVSNLESLDFIIIEFILQLKDNLTYKIFENCDHSFQNKDQNFIYMLIKKIREWYDESENSVNIL